MNNIKVKSTYHPDNPISEEEWLKEFNVGKRYTYEPCVILDELMTDLKKIYSSGGKGQILSGKTFNQNQK
jgi:hypothetical protein